MDSCWLVGAVRHDWSDSHRTRDGEIFYSFKEARVVVGMWRQHDNKIGPHRALGYKPPAPEAILPSIKMAIAKRQKLTQHVV